MKISAKYPARQLKSKINNSPRLQKCKALAKDVVKIKGSKYEYTKILTSSAVAIGTIEYAISELLLLPAALLTAIGLFWGLNIDAQNKEIREQLSKNNKKS